MKSHWVAVGLIALASAAGAADKTVGSYSDPLYGFSLEIPELGDSSDALVVQRASFAAPASDGFAANCNVQVQFLEMSFASYMDMSRRQFAGAGLEVVSEEESRVSGRPAATIEYTGTLGGRKLPFVALAVGGEDRVWLVTCTALAEDFEQYREDFAALRKSFEVSPE